MSFKQSESFKQNRFFWKMFGLWPGKTPSKYYKYFSFIYLTVTLIAYNTLLTLSLYNTPRKIDVLIREAIFPFTEIAVTSKVFMILFKRKKLLAIFELLDCEEFKGNDDTGKEIVKQHNSNYKIYLMINTIVSNFSYMTRILFPVFGFLFYAKTLDLPVCQYYFLSEETKNYYFVLIFIYQSFGIYGHVMYNVNIDSLIVGFMVLAIAQVKVLGHALQNLKVEKDESGSKEELERRQMEKLHKCFKHYELTLRFCEEFQDIISAAMFVQYGIGSAIMCAILCGLLMPFTAESFLLVVGYLFVMNMQIFLPAWLGTQLQYESHELMVAAYEGDWIPRSEGYKRSIGLFVERAKRPIEITGLKMFPLALSTYISIMKTAYSCFTLVRFFQDRKEQ